jgi:hypothetical protein
MSALSPGKTGSGTWRSEPVPLCDLGRCCLGRTGVVGT